MKRSPAFQRGGSSGAGFSLLELIVVLSIVATLASIAVPRYGLVLNGYRVRLAARRIEVDLATARSRAESLSVTQTVAFSVHPGPSQYHLLGPTAPGGVATVEVTRLDEGPYNVRIISADFGGDASLQFNGHGMPDTGGSVTVESGNRRRTITIPSPLDAIPVE